MTNDTVATQSSTMAKQKSQNQQKHTFGSCTHIKQLAKQQLALNAYKIIFETCVAISGSKSASVKDTSCTTCKSFSGRIHACLSCVHFCCLENNHLPYHFHTSKNTHALFVELLYGHIFCSHCQDYVYDDKFEDIARRYMISMSTRAQSRKLRLQAQQLNWNTFSTISDAKRQSKYSNMSVLVAPPQVKAEKKRKKNVPVGDGFGGRAGATSPVLVQAGANRLVVKKESYIGLRGMINLGNTCFMNTIIQALCHTSTLRDYFLSEKHVGQCGHCRSTTGSENAIDSSNCIVCEMSRIFQQFYGGKTTPYCPDRLLYLVWTQARHLAGYEQQDAHEFLIALLDLMHQHLAPRSSTPTNRALWEPPVTMIDRIFTGRLQSDVICNPCGNVSTTIDPFSDISLDIPIQDDGQSGSTITVTDCLTHFTRTEELGPQCKINCSKCGTYQESSKQLSINLLPIVVCLHFKRFEQSHTGSGRKIGTFIAFPEEMSLEDFMAERISQGQRNRLLDDEDESNQSEPTTEIDSLYGESSANKRLKLNDTGTTSTPFTYGNEASLRFKYSLYAVVMHSGTLQSGHYTAFIKKSGEWFSCNDHTITKTTTQEVLNSQAYLLFYHKKYLEYE